MKHGNNIITSFNNIVPNIMIPLKGDKKIFIHGECKEIKESKIENNKHYMCFIDVPKRFQSIDDNLVNLNDTEEQVEAIIL